MVDYAHGDPTGYTPEQFQQWYQGQFGQAIDPTLLGQIGTAVGAPGGPGGQYTQAQYQQGQQMATTHNQNAAPFFPEFQAPVYEQGPAYAAPQPFQAPTMDQAMNDPGYQFALNQGLGALQTRQNAAGVARTGGAMKGLIDYGQQAASAQYDKVYGRAAQQYQQDYQMGRDAWLMNDQARRDAYDRSYQGASDAFNARFRGRELQFEDLYRRWRDKANIEAQMALAD